MKFYRVKRKHKVPVRQVIKRGNGQQSKTRALSAVSFISFYNIAPIDFDFDSDARYIYLPSGSIFSMIEPENFYIKNPEIVVHKLGKKRRYPHYGGDQSKNFIPKIGQPYKIRYSIDVKVSISEYCSVISQDDAEYGHLASAGIFSLI